MASRTSLIATIFLPDAASARAWASQPGAGRTGDLRRQVGRSGACPGRPGGRAHRRSVFLRRCSSNPRKPLRSLISRVHKASRARETGRPSTRRADVRGHVVEESLQSQTRLNASNPPKWLGHRSHAWSDAEPADHCARQRSPAAPSVNGPLRCSQGRRAGFPGAIAAEAHDPTSGFRYLETRVSPRLRRARRSDSGDNTSAPVSSCQIAHMA